MKFFFSLLFFCSFFAATEAQIILNPRYFGAFIVNNQNDTIRGMVKLPKSASKGDFSYTDVMWKIRFIGKNGIEQKITPDEIKQYTFWLENGKEISFISHPNTVKAFGGLMNNTDKMFLEQTKKGRIKLFKGYFYQKNEEVDEVSTINFIQKDNGKIRKFKYIFFRYDLVEYIKDNRELAKKLRHQAYEPQDLEAVIEEYNNWYANQPKQ